MSEKKTRVVFVGICGYGAYNFQELLDYGDPGTYEITGAVDPRYEDAPCREKLRELGIPCYRDLEGFYRERQADLAVFTTPIQLHRDQCVQAMERGSHVLCEKPLVPVLQDVAVLRDACARTGRLLGVGFQWSFCTPMLELKRDILAGVFGKPRFFSSCISWPRYDSYYETGGWKGRIRDAAGNWVLDSVSTNATAHYLHNIFFLLGGELGAARLPSAVRASLYRAKDIESFDTCFVEGEFEGGAQFFFAATHSGEKQLDPSFRYEFENAVVTMRGTDAQEPEMTAAFRDGTQKRYASPQSDASRSEKLTKMIAAVRGETGGKGAVTCTMDTVLPHLLVSNALFDQVPITPFPRELCYRTENPAGTFVRDLAGQLERCVEEKKSPSRLGWSWAAAPVELDLAGYTRFEGARFR